MKVLLIGSGGREHALAWKIRQSPLVEHLYCAPGNPGIGTIATRVPIDASDVEALASFAEAERIDLTVVGPERPLTLGIAEQFERRGLRIFGASAPAAEIESSKVFAKEFMRRHGIPTASCEVFTSSSDAIGFLASSAVRYPLVVKADGLAAGKGVVICAERSEAEDAVRAMMDDQIHGLAGRRIVVEEFLEGREASFFAITDGAGILPLATCQDYKRAYDDDRGPNTGGMGAYSPSVYVDPAAFRSIQDSIVAPTVSGMASEGRVYRGVLYVGLMLTASGPRVLEYNARFGDPEAQVLLPRITSDLVPVLLAAAEGRLDARTVDWRKENAVTVVLASEGYPGQVRKGMPVFGLREVEMLENVFVFQAGTADAPGPRTVVDGGRVLAVTALGVNLASAAARAYEGAARISFDGMHCRMDIGRDAIKALATAERSVRPSAN